MAVDVQNKTLEWFDRKPEDERMFSYEGADGKIRERRIKYFDVVKTERALAEEVRPGIFCTSYDLDGFHFCNRLDMYAVAEPGRVLFIDCGLYDLSDVDHLETMLGKMDASWPDADLFITHLHDDHSGNAPYCLDRGVRRLYRGEAEPFTPAATGRFLVDSGAEAAGDQAVHPMIDFVLGAMDPVRRPNDRIEVSRNGDSFDIAGMHLEVVETPGHTKDHLCLLEPERRLYFAGDHIIKGTAGFMTFAADQHAMKHWADSMNELKGAGLEAVYMSHHPALNGADEIRGFIEDSLKAYEKPVGQVLSILKDLGPSSAYDVSRVRHTHPGFTFADHAPALRGNRVAIDFGYLEYLYDTGAARRHRADDGTLIYEAVSA